MTSAKHSALRKVLATAGALSMVAGSFVAVPAAFAADNASTGYSVSAQRTQGLPGQYQVAHSAKNNKLWITGSNGRPPILTGTLARVNPDTLQIEAVLQLPTVDRTDKDGNKVGKQIVSPYGVEVDDVNNTVWVTNTRTNMVSVYDQTTMKQVWASEANAIDHPREVIIDNANNQAIVSGSKALWAVDLTSHAIKKIDVQPEATGRAVTMNMALDSKAGLLYVPQLASEKLNVVDTKSFTIKQVIDLHKDDASAALAPSDVAFDESLNEIYVTAQGTKGVNAGITVYDKTTGEYKRSIAFGTQILAIDNDEARDLLYATDFKAGTVTVIDAKTSKVVSTVVTGGQGFVNDVEVLPNGTAIALDEATVAQAEVPFTIDPATGEYKKSNVEPKGENGADTAINAGGITKINVTAGAANSTKDIIPTQTVSANQDKGATVTAPTEVVPGETITFTGAGWTREDGKGVQIQPKVNRKEAEGFSAFTANADGTFSVTYTIPANTAVDTELAVNFLSGSLQEGDPTRGAGLKLKVVKEHQKEVVSAEATTVNPDSLAFQGYGQVADYKTGLSTPEPPKNDNVTPDLSKPGVYEFSATEMVRVYQDGAKLYYPKTWENGTKLVLRGEGFTTLDKASGSIGALKIRLNGKDYVTPKVAPVAPAGVTPNSGGMWTYLVANADGTFTAEIEYPITENSSLKQNIQTGDKLSFYLLTGSLKDGDASRGGMALEYTFTIKDSNGNAVPREDKAQEPAKKTYKYNTCEEAKADGLENIKVPHPDVNPAMDADNDGVACETTAKSSTKASTSSSKKLASTGANGVLIASGIGALAVIAGAVLVARRRKA
ncbi:MAG: excalibur calcium-binding domain-containing protein [Rothia sp. (in: high G+C Gram-positive bacteria)]|uniref:excalibur calcium-binding domain-containing protein n=1 Tax=Rothia sp. (in: high G+C Gram-positive bacteria) TaxID=1885016 RepID=UPI0026DFDFE5|nr:excalibur calcium-binding domain-containing protein [Rothia sp. (in: high G+C Gram-positive bacteria)]MDO5749960.1 excalibur calcium-binding domain-containing protein [Rothia sp. (in: high G+C Gram-positive bacteria)]